MATVNDIKLIRTGNPAEKLIAYVRETKDIDPLIIRRLAGEISGRIIKLPNGEQVWRIVLKDNPNYPMYTDDTGKSALGF